MQVQNRPINEITPYGKNAKKHPDKQVVQVADSIKEFGFNQPIVVDKEGVIIVGHGRFLAAHFLGLKEVPTLTLDIDEDKAKAYRLADNKLNESEWDISLVIQELETLSLPMIDLTGFSRELLLKSEPKDDEVPEIPEEPKSKLGDLYELGNHRILCGDSTKIEDVEKLMDGKKADMVFTDPPYGMNLKPKKNYASRKRNTKSEEYRAIEGDAVEFDMSKVFECIKCDKWWVWGADYLHRTIPNFRDGSITVWSKRMSETENKVFGSAFELVWVYPRQKREIWFVRGINQSSERLGEHPTQKPTELGVRAISRNTKEGNIIYDAFLGSGSTLIASEKTGRICYGIELDPRYISVIIERWSIYTGKDPILKETADPNDSRKGLAWSVIKNLSPSESL